MHIVDTPEPNTTDASESLCAVTEPGYKTNVTTLTERIAIRLAGQGAEHPVAAAITLAIRGALRQERSEFADTLSIAPADLRALESGTIALADLPQPLWALAHEHRLEPVLLVDLDHQLRGGTPEH